MSIYRKNKTLAQKKKYYEQIVKRYTIKLIHDQTHLTVCVVMFCTICIDLHTNFIQETQ